jgi:2-polyprenyl-3-methyl-5-hydroxy-6-metoxy-1,4-benzoquinol methylase
MKNITCKVQKLYRNQSLLSRFLVWGRLKIFDVTCILNYVPDNSDVLEIGCGTGVNLNYLNQAKKISFGHGFDIKPSSIKIAKSSASLNGDNNLSFRVVNSIDDFPKEQYLVVLLVDVIHHVPQNEQQDFILEAFARVRPGGVFIYKDMANTPISYALANKIHDFIISGDFIHYVPISKVENLLSSEGGRVMAKKSWKYFVYAHELLIIQK